MKRDRILIVGSFQKPEKQKIFGGIAKSCYEILNSKSFSEFDIITIDSTSLNLTRSWREQSKKEHLFKRTSTTNLSNKSNPKISIFHTYSS